MNLLRDAEGRVRAPFVVGVFTLVAVAVSGGLWLLLGLFGLLEFSDLDSPRIIFATAPTLLSGITATVVAWLAFRERTGLLDSAAALRFAQGLALGALALTIACVVPTLVGSTSLSLTSKPITGALGAGLIQLITLSPAGFGEELLLRGLGFNALRRGIGDIAAVIVSSVIFGALHLLNPSATWLAALEVALVGLWFGTLTVRTGSLWLAMGLHVAWNFFEGFVFGQPVSGNTPGTSLFLARYEPSPSFWSGGAFGPEAAGWTAVVLATGIIITLAVPRRSAVLT